MSRSCMCSGEYVATRPRPMFLQKMRTLFNIAEFQDLKLVREVVSWVLEQNGQAASSTPARTAAT